MRKIKKGQSDTPDKNALKNGYSFDANGNSAPSEEVLDIIGKRPFWVIRYGSVAILLIFIILFFLSRHITYPEIMRKEITLKPQDADIIVKSESFGRVSKILVLNNQKVRKNEVVGLLETPEDYQLVVLMDSILNGLTRLADGATTIPMPDPYSINTTGPGDLTASFQDVRRAFSEWKSNKGNRYANLLESIKVAKKEVAEWKRKNVLYSPIEGTVSFIDLTAEGQVIKAGEDLFCISQPGCSFSGTMNISRDELTMIQPGQSVYIDVAGYPSAEYGNLKGNVGFISTVPGSDGSYWAKIVLPNGVRTDLNKLIKVRNGMNGSASMKVGELKLAMVLFRGLKRFVAVTGNK